MVLLSQHQLAVGEDGRLCRTRRLSAYSTLRHRQRPEKAAAPRDPSEDGPREESLERRAPCRPVETSTAGVEENVRPRQGRRLVLARRESDRDYTSRQAATPPSHPLALFATPALSLPSVGGKHSLGAQPHRVEHVDYAHGPSDHLSLGAACVCGGASTRTCRRHRRMTGAAPSAWDIVNVEPCHLLKLRGYLSFALDTAYKS
ncbi:hypothetical protein MRX96_054905 [Rhipicephalus microplus]